MPSSITATTTKGACTVTAPKVTCTQKSPDPAARAARDHDRDVKGFVTNTAGSLITNTATVTGDIKNKSRHQHRDRRPPRCAQAST